MATVQTIDAGRIVRFVVHRRSLLRLETEPGTVVHDPSVLGKNGVSSDSCIDSSHRYGSPIVPWTGCWMSVTASDYPHRNRCDLGC